MTGITSARCLWDLKLLHHGEVGSQKTMFTRLGTLGRCSVSQFGLIMPCDGFFFFFFSRLHTEKNQLQLVICIQPA